MFRPIISGKENDGVLIGGRNKTQLVFTAITLSEHMPSWPPPFRFPPAAVNSGRSEIRTFVSESLFDCAAQYILEFVHFAETLQPSHAYSICCLQAANRAQSFSPTTAIALNHPRGSISSMLATVAISASFFD